MANWKCPECAVVLDAAEEGRGETCPFCGLDMDPMDPIVDDEPAGLANADTMPGESRFSYRLRAVPREPPESGNDGS